MRFGDGHLNFLLTFYFRNYLALSEPGTTIHWGIDYYNMNSFTEKEEKYRKDYVCT